MWLKYMVLFFQSTAKDTVLSLPVPAPVQMQSLQIIFVPPMYQPAHGSGHSALHSYRGYAPSPKLADIVANWSCLPGSALSHLRSSKLY